MRATSALNMEYAQPPGWRNFAVTHLYSRSFQHSNTASGTSEVFMLDFLTVGKCNVSFNRRIRLAGVAWRGRRFFFLNSSAAVHWLLTSVIRLSPTLREIPMRSLYKLAVLVFLSSGLLVGRAYGQGGATGAISGVVDGY